MTKVYLSQPAMLSAMGNDLAQHVRALLQPENTLTSSNQWVKNKTLQYGAVNQPLRPFDDTLPETQKSRNNQLLWTALAQIENDIQAAINRYGSERVAVVMGTSTSGADENIPMFENRVAGGQWGDVPFNHAQHLMAAPADFVAEQYGLGNLRYVISTACTSGARALISAARLLKAGLCDAVICGGVDTLSPLTINGFAALEVLSSRTAQPFANERDGINIGEAAAVFVMTRDADFAAEQIALLGYGASSDAHHMSSPRPDGLGAAQAFQAALNQAKLSPEHIGWINLHGTGTQLNDSMESQAVAQVFGNNTPCTSTKVQTGHTLGAAGALEAAILWAMISRQSNPSGQLPAQLNHTQPDPALPPIALTHSGSHWQTNAPRIGASSSFAFGGNNSVLVMGEVG